MVLLVLDEHTVRPIRQLGACGAAVGHVWRAGTHVPRAAASGAVHGP